MSCALVFPGQGSQTVGMARDLAQAFPTARDVLAAADDVLGYALSTLMFEGPDELLTQTVHAQPAIFVASVAAWRCWPAAPPDITAVAGHSVGEYSALLAAETLTYEDGLRLVQRRGQIMQQAAETAAGGMIAALGVDQQTIEQACADVAPLIVCAANYNAPGQIIISGEEQGLAAVTDLLKSRGARRIMRLNVSAAFHSPVMSSAAALLRQDIERTPLAAPRWPVFGNVTATPLTTVEDIRAELASQIAAPVRWEQSVRAMIASGVRRMVEIGPGSVLSGLTKRIDPAVETAAISSAEDIRAVAV